MCNGKSQGWNMSLLGKLGMDVNVWAHAKKRPASFSLFIYLVLLEPGFQLAFIFRIRETLVNVPFFGRFLRRILWYWTTIYFSSDIGVDLKCGGGVYFPHPFGIVINGQCQIGENVTILHNVTLGINRDALSAPILLDGCYVGAGATCLGPVIIGEKARLGAGAVLLTDMPSNSSYVGIPARRTK